MNDLLQLALEAHGGLEQWNGFEKVAIQMKVGGILWTVKGQEGVLNNSQIEVELRNQRGRYLEFNGKKGQETYFTPKEVSIINNGYLVEALFNPRDSFIGHELQTPWTRLQLIYFGTYAMWEYLTIPFNLTLPGFNTKELTPWHEGGETWRRMEVHFPNDWAYHSKEQVFYFDEKGLLKRMDYNVDISGNTAAAQYVFDYQDFQGIKLPTRRLVYGRDAQNQYVKEPVVVSINLLDVHFD